MNGSARAAEERIRIRPAAREDLAAIGRIEAASFSDPWSARSFQELLGRGSVAFLVATEAERLVGYAVALHAVDEAELANVAVDETARGQGIGAMLVRATLDAVRAAGAQDCWLEVRASNAGARSLYRHLGFDDVGIRTRYYARPVEDAIVMRRALRGA